jgi:predicted transcriptional regulator
MTGEIPYGKELVIKEQSFEEFEEKSVKRLEEALEGEDVPVTVGYDDPEKIRQILTQKRQELMKAILTQEPESIRDLAEKVDRGLREVHEDLELLEENKIVYFEKEGNRKKPVIPFKDIKVDYSLKDSLFRDESAGERA